MTAAKRREPDSFDAYWAEVSNTATETIRGVTVRVPSDIPLVLEQRIGDLKDSSDENDIAELIGLLFGVGPDAFEAWRQAGMGVTEFQVVLAWGMAHADGNPMSFADAHALVLKAEAEGKARQAAPNRAARRASSGSSGGPSKATSARTTASTRKASRA